MDQKKSACRYCRDYKHVSFSSGPTPFLRSIFPGPRKPPVPLFLVCRPIILLFVLLASRPMLSDIANGTGYLVFRRFSQLLSNCLPQLPPPPPLPTLQKRIPLQTALNIRSHNNFCLLVCFNFVNLSVDNRYRSRISIMILVIIR